MSTGAFAAVGVALVSLVAAVFSRLTMTPLVGGIGLQAAALVQFAQTCLLLAIALAVLGPGQTT